MTVAKETLRQAKQALVLNPDVTSVGIGYRYKDGKRTEEVCIVVGVKKKLPAALVPSDRLIPREMFGARTDVQEKRFEAYSLVEKRRPCPPGYSIGHVAITAGTLGFFGRRGTSDEWRLFSNNHVLANSNSGSPDDTIIQPGKADGGFSGSDRFALLEDYVRIRWDGEGDGNEDGKKKAAAFLWRAWMAPANLVARLVGCDFRLHVRPRAIEQPSPNLVDAAVARPVLQTWVDPAYPFLADELAGVRDLQLGDRVQKVGRTTEHTRGTVEGVNAMVKVDYRGPVATFEDQIEIRADSGEFSQPGDSGSAILTMDDPPYLGGLLFAGGEGVTIANRISHVLSLLGARI